MQWSDINFRPTERTLRQFAGLWLVFFGGLAAWQWFVRGNETFPGIIALLAFVIGAAGFLVPRSLRPIYVGWMVLAFPIGWTVSRIVLMIIFYGIFTPVALLFRLIGRDALRLKRQPDAQTYWAPRRPVTDRQQYFRQF